MLRTFYFIAWWWVAIEEVFKQGNDLVQFIHQKNDCVVNEEDNCVLKASSKDSI